MSIMLSVHHLTKLHQGSLLSLQDVSFTVKQGKFVAFHGKQVCGKTTLLKLLAQQDEPTSGTMEWDEPREIAYISATSSLLRDLTVEENIAMPLILRGMAPLDIERKVSFMLDKFNLRPLRKYRAQRVKGRDYERLLLARAFAVDPDILLLDEPSASLLDVVKGLNVTVVYATSEAHLAVQANEVYFLHEGKIIQHFIPRADSAKATVDYIYEQAVLLT